MTNISTLKPWETKTVEHLTQEEILEWIEWTLLKNYKAGRSVSNTASDIMHNVLLWERNKKVDQISS